MDKKRRVSAEDPQQDETVDRLAAVVRKEMDRVLQEHRVLKPLMSIQDVARSLGISTRSCETLLAAGELPKPLWIGGVRRWHPDSISAFLRSREGRKR